MDLQDKKEFDRIGVEINDAKTITSDDPSYLKHCMCIAFYSQFLFIVVGNIYYGKSKGHDRCYVRVKCTICDKEHTLRYDDIAHKSNRNSRKDTGEKTKDAGPEKCKHCADQIYELQKMTKNDKPLLVYLVSFMSNNRLYYKVGKSGSQDFATKLMDGKTSLNRETAEKIVRERFKNDLAKQNSKLFQDFKLIDYFWTRYIDAVESGHLLKWRSDGSFNYEAPDHFELLAGKTEIVLASGASIVDWKYNCTLFEINSGLFLESFVAKWYGYAEKEYEYAYNKSLSCNLEKMSGHPNITLKEYLTTAIRTHRLNNPMPRKNGSLSEACFPEPIPTLM